MADGQSGNRAPTITGNPPTGIVIGETYDFRPSAFDADSDSLAFQLQHKPVWSSFDSTTGRIYGQPTLAHVGTYEKIIISVSDGKNTSAMPAFSIIVSQSALGTVTLSWVPPTNNSDGTPLRDLAGYKVYYGRNSRSYDQMIRIDNPGITTYVVEHLSPDTYYFAATAFNISNVESSFSSEISKTVD